MDRQRDDLHFIFNLYLKTLICAYTVDTELIPTFCLLERPLFFCEELQNQQANEGETAFLCCQLSKPGVAVQWKKGALVLRPGGKYKMKQDGCELQLHIHDLTVRDSGAYRCCTDSIETRASLSVKGIYQTSKATAFPYQHVITQTC